MDPGNPSTGFNSSSVFNSSMYLGDDDLGSRHTNNAGDRKLFELATAPSQSTVQEPLYQLDCPETSVRMIWDMRQSLT